MAKYQGEAAMKEFQAAKTSAAAAQQAGATLGYYGRPLMLNKEAKMVLSACIVGADSEIARDKQMQRGE